jgi:hypothetical protein
MSMVFQIIALHHQQFEDYFLMTDQELSEHRAKRISVENKPGYPCRVSLQDAEVGERILLINYQHQEKGGPYQASHAIFVRENQPQAELEADFVPESIRQRVISLRAFNVDHDMIGADICDGDVISPVLNQMFENSDVSYIHLHNAKPGCFAAKVVRV